MWAGVRNVPKSVIHIFFEWALIKAMRKTVFAEIFIFASFGNRRFSKIRVGASFSSFYRTRLVVLGESVNLLESLLRSLDHCE